MTSTRHHQKQLAKKKKARELTRKSIGRQRSPASAYLRVAATLPFGPAYMSRSWRSDDGDVSELVTVALTRILPDGRLFPTFLLVDRTCLGVKNAFAPLPMTWLDFNKQLDLMGQAHDEGIEEVSVLQAQSVVYHAINFARSLGFAPHPDFSPEVVGPEPEILEETPLAHPVAPNYVQGPHDDVNAILPKLNRFGNDATVTLIVPKDGTIRTLQLGSDST